MRILAIAGAVLLGALLIFIGAFGARWLVPAEGTDAAPVALAPAADADPAATVKAELDLELLRQLLAVLDPGRRGQIIDSKENFAKFVQQETLNQAVLKAAYANGANNNDAIKVLMERAGQRVLVEAYLNEVVRLNLDPAFPSAEQVREAYDKNPTVFRLPQRIHLWQIFLPLDAAADSDASKAAWQQAERIAADLKRGKASFADMAKQHSTHTASRVNDGYMGLIRVDELLPPIAAAALALKVDGISAPIATEGGLHIVKRGQIVAEEPLQFAAVEARIRERLRREAAFKVRQAAVEKIAEEFPVAAPTDDIEAWREQLRAAPPAPTTQSESTDAG